MKTNKKKVTTIETLKFCLNWGKKYPFLIFFSILPSILVPLNDTVLPYMLKKIIDNVSILKGKQMLQKILPFVIGYILCLLVWETAWRLYSYFVNVKYNPQLRRSIVLDSMENFFKKSPRFFQNEMSGKLTKRVMDLADMPIDILFLLLNRGVLRSVALVGSILMLFFCQKTFGFIMIAFCLFISVFMCYFFPKIIKCSEEYSNQGSVINGEITDIFTNISSVRLFANWKIEKTILEKSTNIALQKERKMEKLYLFLFIGASASFVLLQTISLFFLIKLKMIEEITAGDFTLVMMINFNTIQCIWELTFDLINFTKYFGKTQQALKSLYAEVELLDKPDSKKLEIKNGDIIFDKVYFKYDNHLPNTFENFSCTIKSGEKIGLVGESGAGKTTFVNLLLRQYDVQSGSIFIDNQNIKFISQDSLHQNIGIIPQDPSLFHRSLYENISYGNPIKNEFEVYQAANSASAHDFIIKTENGYNTLVGERGIKLSGGQRQRITIARAFLKNSPILILDEATSALDSVTEKEIQKTLWQLMQNKTCIVVAHRLSTLLDMDRILVFEKGKIIQDGSHTQLIANEGVYKKLWETQVSGFINL
jgi:ATP-binding cassette subfamily B protein